MIIFATRSKTGVLAEAQQEQQHMPQHEQLPELTGQLYEELRRCARRILANQSAGLTLQTTDVVHEACLRLIESPAQFESRTHLYRCAAKAMRHLLVDHARAKSAQKRNGVHMRTVWMDNLLGDIDVNLGLLTIDQTLTEMSQIGERLESIAELHYLAGFTQARVAEILNISVATVERELKFARAFLTDRLQELHHPTPA
ncbi:ECF-type sigma factor [Microbulbifer agarilyticus]|uniref:ECF-type sigma factor n=1 Tax=Microbulbifer agarilyticus TaxID=260552 RepID=UPI001CD3755A|nr:ECF-type sigma factor [Microbulbifer agarilyticus]MCA0894515.1 sigma-70 family RNA polymerase sigma factor [Microbulbifer agarilyticus]